MSEIFISYSRKDKVIVEKFVKILIERGFNVWWDKNIVGGNQFNDTIEERLNSSKCVIVVWTKNSIKSIWVKAEASIGLGKGILIPVILDKDIQIPLPFNSIHTINLFRESQGIIIEELEKVYLAINSITKSNNRNSRKDLFPSLLLKKSIKFIKRFSYISISLILLALSLIIFELKSGKKSSKVRFALDITGEWNDKTSDIRIGLDMIRAENVSRGRNQYAALEEKRAIDLYNSTPKDSLDYILRGHIISVLNHFEYIARAFESGAADQEIIEESLYPVMTRTYCILEPFVNANNSIASGVMEKKVSSWPPLERVIDGWREKYSIDCDSVTKKWGAKPKLK